MSDLRIQTLGTFRVWLKGQLISNEAWPTHKSQLLLKFLLTERGHFVPAERLMDILWPDLPPKRAQNNLWVTVSQARRVLQPDLPRRAKGDYLLTRREGYTFNRQSDHWLDADEFEAHLRAARQAEQPATRVQAFEAARRLYRGDYLEEDPYEEWALATRDQLRNDYLALLADLAEAYARQGSYRRAISLCHQSLATENTDETVYRQLMLYHYCAGDQNTALKAYDECARVLRDEIDVEPMPETTDLYRQIQRRHVIAVDRDVLYPRPVQALTLPYSLSRTPFVGREQEYGHLVGLVAKAAAGQGSVVLLEGEPGVGKSRLVQEATGFALAQGTRVLFARCYQVERAMPYQPLIDLARQVVEGWPAETLLRLPTTWLAEITTLVPKIAGIAPSLPSAPADVGESPQGRLFQALVRLFAAVAGDGGLVLVVDDIQWADPSSLQFLHHLARHIAEHPVLLVGTFRSAAGMTDDDLAIFVHAVKREPHADALRLTRLTEGEVTNLLERMGGSSSQVLELGRWLYRETEGNPFFLISILQSLLEQGLLTLGEDEWQMDPQALGTAGLELTLPEALRESVRERLRRVPKGVRRIVDLAAVLGRRFDFGTLQAVVGQSQEMLLDALDDLLVRQLLQEEEDGHRYDFSHDKIREVVYYDLSGARRALYHRGVAETLTAQPGGSLGETASILAHHFERAGETAKALDHWLRAGAHALTTYAPQQAARHYERALALAQRSAEKSRAYYGLARAHFALDDHQAAIADLSQGLHLVEEGDERRGRMLYLLADVHFARYDVEASEKHVRAALAAAELVDDPETVSQSLSLLGQVYSGRGDLEAEFDLIDRALRISRDTGNRWREGRTLADRGWLQAQTAVFGPAADSARQALQLLETTDDLAGVAFAWNVLGRALGGRGEYEAAMTAFRRSGEIAQEIDHKFLVAQVPNMLGWLHGQLGDHEGALVHDREGVEIASRWGKSPPEISARINVALDLLRLGDAARALADLEAILAQIERDVSGFHAWRWRLRVFHTQGLCHLALNEPRLALDLAEKGMALAEPTSSRKYVALNHDLRGAALAALEQPVAAIAELAVVMKLADELHYQPLRWQARRRLAELCEQTGRDSESERLLAEAARIVRDIAGGLSDGALRAIFLGAEPVRDILSP